MLRLADLGFAAFHLLLIAFNLTGWIWTRTRRLHLVVITLTIVSWFGLGIYYGWGYCALTDWHWQVKRALGETGLPGSFVKYYADRATGMDWSGRLVDQVVLIAGLTALGASVWVNARDWRRGRG